MKKHKNVHSFRPPSRDPRQISERSLVCENPPRRFVFAQMTVGLEECYERIRCDDGSKDNNIVLENQAIDEEEFSPIPGSILAGRYKVIAKVGEGQSSVLVKAEDIFHPNKRHVAIKILHASYRNLGPQEASCLLHLKKADTLRVANIAHILNTFTVGQHFCIVFEFLSPTPLYKYFQTFPFPSKVEKIKLIRRIAFQVTQCLAVLSSLNIIHSDIKPENILFTNGDKNDVKIIDFGNAIYWVHDEMSLYFDSFELQTVFYRAPEVMFGLPFGPQIDMWSLGCVLAELYLGEPLFLATSKDAILEKMQALLGPFPMSPFQSGKYFSTFKKFVGRVSSVPGFSKNVVNILKKLGSTDYVFADFLAKLLTFDPSLRLSPIEAARHPFLAPECALGFMLPPGYMTQESTYSPILLTPATYPHRPKIDEKIKKLHYSELDLLRVGTQANTMGKADNVMKVLPFNYQEESSNGNKGEKCIVTNESNAEAKESRNTVGKNTAERFGNNETSIAFGVSIENKSHNRCPVNADRRDNPYNESCSVFHATKDTRSISVKENQTYNDCSESCSVVNLVKVTKLLQGSVKRGQKDDTSGEFCSVLNTTKETCSSTLFFKQNERDNPFDPNKSCSVLNTIKDPSSCTGSVKGGQRGNAFDETCKVLNTAKDKRSSTLFAKQHERDNPFNESCSVLNTIKNPSSCTGSVKGGQRGNAFDETCKVLNTAKDKRSSTLFAKQHERDNPFNESCSVLNTIKNPSSCTGSVKGGQRGNAFDETCKVLNTAKDKRSSTLFAKQHERDNPFNESCSVLNTIKDPSSCTGSVKGGQRGNAFDETCKVLNTAKDKRSSTLFAKQHERDNPFNESCSVLNTIKNPPSPKVHKGRGKNEKRARKFVLRKSSKSLRRRDSESRSSVSTDDVSEDNTDCRKRYNAQSMSPAKLSDAQDKTPVKFINDDELLLVNVPEPRDITRTAKSSPARRTSSLDEIQDDVPKGSADKTLDENSRIIPHQATHKGSSRKHSDKKSNSAIPPTRRTSRHDDRILEYMPKSAENRVVEDNVTATRKAAYKGSSSETSYKEANSATPPTRRTSRHGDRILEDIQKSAANRVVEDNVTATRKAAYKGSSNETSYKEANSAIPSTRRTSTFDEKILKDMPKTAAKRNVDGVNIIVSPNATHKSSSSETSDKETCSDISPARRTTGRQNKIVKSSTIEMKSLANSAEESSGKSKNETCVSKTKDKPNPNVASAVGRRKNKKTQQVLSSGVKDDAQTKPTLSTIISHQTREDVSTTCNNYQDYFSVTSSSKQGILHMESYRNSKKPVSTKPSFLESFFDAFSDDETNIVSSSTKSGELQTKTKGISKRSVPTKSSNSKVLTNNENSSSSEKLTTVTSSNKQDTLSQKSSSNGKRLELENPSNFQAFSEDKSSASSEEVILITSSNTQDELPPKSSTDEKRTKPTKSSNFQSFSESKNNCSCEESKLFASSNKQDKLPANSNNNGKRTKSPKSSNCKSFSEDKNSSGLELTLVTSSNKEGRLQANSSNNGKRTKSQNFQVFSEDKYSSFDEELTFAISTNKQDKLQTKSKINEKRAKPEKSKNFQEFSKDKNNSSGEEIMLVTSSNKQDRLSARRKKKGNRNMSANSWNFQSFSEDRTNSSRNESRMVTSSINQGNKSKSNISSVENNKVSRTPNLQKRESVFDTPIPCSVVSSTGKLLPGGLSEVKKTICRAEKEQNNSLYEIHDIFQARLVDNSETLSKEKQDTEISGKTYKRYKYTSPGENTERVSVERNSRFAEGGHVLKNESQDSKKEKGNRNLPEEMETSYPTDILTQATVKQPRKRKLEYSTVNSPVNSSHTMSCLESLRDRQVAKIQKLSDAEQDDSDDDYDVLLL